MYHRPKFTTHLYSYLVVLLFAFLLLAKDSVAAFQAAPFMDGLEVTDNASAFSVMPQGQFYKHKPKQATIYKYDDLPLGKRTPLLIVHGLRGEYYPVFRWGKLIKRLKSNKEFGNKYKIYLVRYDSIGPLDKAIPQMQEKIAQLYESSDKKQIVVLALSIGGNLIYESMLKPETDKQIKLFIAMGTPFHGSPLFCADWLQYGLYKNLSWPWTRVDHSLAYRLYFARNPNLLIDFRWDNCDQAIPSIGHFASKLPLGPQGFLKPEQAANNRLITGSEKSFDKSKLITYSGYVLNPYQWPEAARVIEGAFLAPYTMCTISLPFHLAREHAVLKKLNRIIATTVTTESAAKKAKTNFVYVLNDGIAPVTSSMFLANQYCSQGEVTHETDLQKLRPLVDVHTARIFRNIDHLTYIDGGRQKLMPETWRDELDPQAGARDIFDWILHDLDSETLSPKLSQNHDT